MRYGIHCGHVDEIARWPLFENDVPRTKAQKPLNPHHDPPVCYHRWETTRLGMGLSDPLVFLSPSGSKWE